MPVVNLKYPDGRVESKKLLSAINKNGTEIAVVDLEFVDNGHKVTGILYNSDGFYHNIVDQAKWDEIRGLLVDSIHGLLTDDDYNVVSEINVSADPYRQLSLRDENFVSLTQNYEAYLSRIKSNEQVNVPNEEQSIETSNLANTNTVDLNNTEIVNQSVNETVSDVEISPAQVAPETPNLENVNLNGNVFNQIENGTGMENQPVSPIVEEPISNEANSIPMASNMPSLEKEPVNLNSDLLIDNETMQNDLMPQLDTPVESESLITNEPVNVDEVPTNNNMSILEGSPIVPETVTPDLTAPENVQSIIDNVPPVGPVTNDTEAQQDTISLMDAPIDNPFALNDVPTEPVIKTEPAQPEVSANDSIVTNAYMNGFEEIKIAMNQLVQESIERITNIGNEFNEKVDEYASKAKGSLQEASEYGKLLKDRFEATQNNINNVGINPDMLNTPEENQTLKLAA